MGNVCPPINTHVFVYLFIFFQQCCDLCWNKAQGLSWSRAPYTLSRGARSGLTAALSGTSASPIFPAGVAAVSTRKEILPLSLPPEIRKQHCASKALTVIPPASVLLLTFFTSLSATAEAVCCHEKTAAVLEVSTTLAQVGIIIILC